MGTEADNQLVDAARTATESSQDWKWKDGADIRMLYDGDCPLCMREVNMLKRRDEGRGKIDYVDISFEDYSAEQNANISYEQARRRPGRLQSRMSIVQNCAALFHGFGRFNLALCTIFRSCFRPAQLIIVSVLCYICIHLFLSLLFMSRLWGKFMQYFQMGKSLQTLRFSGNNPQITNTLHTKEQFWKRS